jgi:GNAT superfamily N-acetyltransferase
MSVGIYFITGNICYRDLYLKSLLPKYIMKQKSQINRKNLKSLFSIEGAKLGFGLARCFPRHRFHKIPKTVEAIRKRKTIPFWARDKKGRRFGVLLIDKQVESTERIAQIALNTLPNLRGKKIAGVSYLAVKAPKEERGKIYMRFLFEQAKQQLKTEGYSAIIISANKQMTRVYERAGFKRIGTIPNTNEIVSVFEIQ